MVFIILRQDGVMHTRGRELELGPRSRRSPSEENCLEGRAFYLALILSKFCVCTLRIGANDVQMYRRIQPGGWGRAGPRTSVEPQIHALHPCSTPRNPRNACSRTGLVRAPPAVTKYCNLPRLIRFLSLGSPWSPLNRCSEKYGVSSSFPSFLPSIPFPHQTPRQQLKQQRGPKVFETSLEASLGHREVGCWRDK